jgi:hypothetical protein
MIGTLAHLNDALRTVRPSLTEPRTKPNRELNRTAN